MSSSASAREVAERYVEQHKLNSLMGSLAVALLRAQPSDPYEFIRQYGLDKSGPTATTATSSSSSSSSKKAIVYASPSPPSDVAVQDALCLLFALAWYNETPLLHMPAKLTKMGGSQNENEKLNIDLFLAALKKLGAANQDHHHSYEFNENVWRSVFSFLDVDADGIVDGNEFAAGIAIADLRRSQAHLKARGVRS